MLYPFLEWERFYATVLRTYEQDHPIGEDTTMTLWCQTSSGSVVRIGF